MLPLPLPLLFMLFIPPPPTLRPWAELDEMKPGSSSGVASVPLLPDEEEPEAKRPWAEYDGRLYLWLLEFRLIVADYLSIWVEEVSVSVPAEQDQPENLNWRGKKDTGQFQHEMCRNWEIFDVERLTTATSTKA